MARRGLATNEVEIDNQLLKSSDTLASQLLTSSTARGVSISKIGQVTGIRKANSIIGGISVAWSEVLLAQSYEIQIGVDKTFIPGRFETFNVGQHKTSWNYAAGDPEKTYYVRIRARDANGDVGDWSGLLNTKTGQVEANHLVGGSTGNLVTYTFTAFEDQYLGGGDNWVFFAPDPAPDIWETIAGKAMFQSFGGLVFIFVVADIEYGTSFVYSGPGDPLYYPPGQFLVIEVWLNGEFLERNLFGRSTDIGKFVGCDTTNSPLMIGLPTIPGVGIHEYSIRIALCHELIENADGSVIATTPGTIYYECHGVKLNKITLALFEKIR